MPTSTADDALADRRLRLFPNPTSGLLTVDRTDGDLTGFRYRLMTAEGRILRSGPLGRTIDLSGLPRGLYLLEATADGRSEHYRVVRQ